MQSQNNDANASSAAGWPRCPDAGNRCPMSQMAGILGANVQDILISFLGGAENGARLTLQKNRTGFTVQVTGAAKRLVERDSSNFYGLSTLGQNLGPSRPSYGRS